MRGDDNFAPMSRSSTRALRLWGIRYKSMTCLEVFQAESRVLMPTFTSCSTVTNNKLKLDS